MKHQRSYWGFNGDVYCIGTGFTAGKSFLCSGAVQGSRTENQSKWRMELNMNWKLGSYRVLRLTRFRIYGFRAIGCEELRAEGLWV